MESTGWVETVFHGESWVLGGLICWAKSSGFEKCLTFLLPNFILERLAGWLDGELPKTGSLLVSRDGNWPIVGSFLPFNIPKEGCGGDAAAPATGFGAEVAAGEGSFLWPSCGNELKGDTAALVDGGTGLGLVGVTRGLTTGSKID